MPNNLRRSWYHYIGRDTESRLHKGSGRITDAELCKLIKCCSELGAVKWVNDASLESILIGNRTVCYCEDAVARDYLAMCSPDKITLLITRLVEAENEIIRLKKKDKRGVVDDVYSN